MVKIENINFGGEMEMTQMSEIKDFGGGMERSEDKHFVGGMKRNDRTDFGVGMKRNRSRLRVLMVGWV